MKMFISLETIQKADLRMLLWCGRSRLYPVFLNWVRAISKSGDGYMQLLFPLLVWLLSPSLGQDFLLLFVCAFALERSLYYVLKNTLKRQRPPEVIPHFTSIVKASDQFSFPSGHTMAAFLLAALSTMTLGSSAAILYVWATAVGISRVVLGVHFPTDILAGAIIGISIAQFSVSYF